MVGLHMVDDDIVQLVALQHMLDIFKEQIVDRTIHSIQQNSLLVQQNIRIIRNTPGDRIHVFEKGKATIVATHPIQIRMNFSCTIHRLTPPFSHDTNLVYHVFPIFQEGF